MSFRYVPLGDAVVAKIFNRGSMFFKWARDFPICHLARWVQLLGDAGWSPEEATAAIQMSAAAARLRLVRLASRDLLVALDNALRSVGLSFAHFSPAPRKAQ